MYKIIVSCYYWPVVEGPLRLRAIRITTNRRKPRTRLDASKVAGLKSVDTSSLSMERRSANRLKAGCDAELTTSLSILDSDAQLSSESLVFLGRTVDLSSKGLSLVLPSTPIDQRYCDKEARIQLSLHLPKGAVKLEVSPVRCVPLDEEDTALGYLMGAQILSSARDKAEYEDFLRSISNLTLDN